MSEERRNHENIRRRADRVRERLAETLAQSRGATARDERTSERNVTRFGKRRHKPPEDR